MVYRIARARPLRSSQIRHERPLPGSLSSESSRGRPFRPLIYSLLDVHIELGHKVHLHYAVTTRWKSNVAMYGQIHYICPLSLINILIQSVPPQ